ncbi:MAG: DUF1428 domain-containing protein [bacterium]|nr:DUF1428 domain-containing protein [bacterium]MDE0417354.1 DUF1428 domain-containing protein [bacterium]
MRYADGIGAAVPTANMKAFREHAQVAAVVFRQSGALAVIECWGDDVPTGDVTSFPMAVKCQADETVRLSWIRWPSRDVRNEAMPDTRLNQAMTPKPRRPSEKSAGKAQKSCRVDGSARGSRFSLPRDLAVS